MCNSLYKAAITSAQYNSIIILYILSSTVIGILIGSLPNEQHGLSGQFHILNSKTIYIEHFIYDGGGPGT